VAEGHVAEGHVAEGHVAEGHVAEGWVGLEAESIGCRGVGFGLRVSQLVGRGG
jgi:hypothetical protein